MKKPYFFRLTKYHVYKFYINEMFDGVKKSTVKYDANLQRISWKHPFIKLTGKIVGAQLEPTSIEHSERGPVYNTLHTNRYIGTY